MSNAESSNGAYGYVCESCDEHFDDIVDLIRHGCEPIPLAATSLSRKERNTLMYIETRIVDHGGKLDPMQMNYEDRDNIDLFEIAELLEVSDVRRDEDNPRQDVQYVERFSEEAWDLVQDCRQLRAIEDDRIDIDVGDIDE